MNAILLQRLGSLVAPHLCLAIIFGIAWWAPQSPLAPNSHDSSWIMILESALLLASILVGGFAPASFMFFPLILLATIVWLASFGQAAFSWVMLGFVWGVIAAFIEGLRAQRGDFGFARENIAHPHRRYDRVALVYLACLPVFLLLWIVGHPARWIIWGTVYFSVLTLADTVLRGAVDRIPRAILRRMQASVDPEIAAQIGLCCNCMYVQPAIPARKGRYVHCALSTKDKSFPEYPRTPVESCAGFKAQESTS